MNMYMSYGRLYYRVITEIKSEFTQSQPQCNSYYIIVLLIHHTQLVCSSLYFCSQTFKSVLEISVGKKGVKKAF